MDRHTYSECLQNIHTVYGYKDITDSYRSIDILPVKNF